MVNKNSILDFVEKLGRQEEKLISPAKIFFDRYLVFLIALKNNTLIDKTKIDALNQSITIFKERPDFNTPNVAAIFEDIVKLGALHKKILDEDKGDLIGKLRIAFKPKKPARSQTHQSKMRSSWKKLQSNDLLKYAIQNQMENKGSVWSASKSEPTKVYQRLIRLRLLEAVDEPDTRLLFEAFTMVGNEKPDNIVVRDVLSKAVEKNRWDIVQNMLKMQTDNKPTQVSIDKVLSAVTDAQTLSLEKLNIAETILKMTNDNKPSQAAVDSVLLSHLQTENELELVKTILSMQLDNKPSKNAVDKKLHSMSQVLFGNDLLIAEEILKMSGSNKPSQDKVEFVLIKGLSDIASSTQERVLTIIRNMTGDNKPRPQLMSLGDALYNKKWTRVEAIFTSHQSLFDTYIVNYILELATLNNQLNIVQKIINITGANKPSQQSVETCLRSATSLKFFSIVEACLAMSGENAPSKVDKKHYETILASQFVAKAKVSDDLSAEACYEIFINKQAKFSRSGMGIFDNSRTLERLSSVIDAAIHIKGPERLVFMDLKWMDRNGSFTDSTPKSIKEMWDLSHKPKGSV